MLFSLAKRALTEIDPRLMWKFAINCGLKGMRSVNMFESRLKRGEVFPPFLFLSIINSCQLRCQGCWVDVDMPRRMISLDTINRLIRSAKRYGNSFYGILGGEPLLHPQFLQILESNRDCYFQVFTNGHLITDSLAADLRRIGNATPLVSIEGGELVSDQRRGRAHVLSRTLAGLANCRRHRLITGVATSVCQSNIDELVSEKWLTRLIDLGVHYVWYYTYRVIGPRPAPELALTPQQALAMRRFIVEMRMKLPIGIVDAYWNDRGQAMCPMATGISHHIGPGGDIEPCPIIQFAVENIGDGSSVYEAMIRSAFLADFRRTAARATRGCIVLERPELVKELVLRHAARDSTQRQSGLVELDRLQSRSSQHMPGNEVPEKSWLYRFAKKHWFFGFGAYA